MAGEPEAGTVSTEQAMLLLLLDSAAELKRLEKEGAVIPIAPGRYWLKDLVQGFVRYMRAHRDDVDSLTLARCWGMSSQRVGKLSQDGWFKPLPDKRGKYNWMEACGGYIRFLRDEDRRSSKTSAESRIRDAKARDIEVRTQQRLENLVPREIYEEMLENFAGKVRSEFAGLAAATTRDLKWRRDIDRQVNECLRRISEYGLAQAIRLEADGRLADAVRANGARSVGGGKQDVSADSGSPRTP